MFAFGWTNNVSIPSAAPISAFGAFLEDVPSFEGTVYERFIAMRLGALSGVDGPAGLEAMLAALVLIDAWKDGDKGWWDERKGCLDVCRHLQPSAPYICGVCGQLLPFSCPADPTAIDNWECDLET